MKEKYLVVNAGSSSLKFQLFEMPEEKVLINGYVEKIGLEDCFWTIKINGQKIKTEGFLKNHTEATQVLINELYKNHVVESLDEIKGVGHRVLHGGEKYKESVLIDDEVIQNIVDLTKFGPLHHPGNLAGIRAIEKAIPGVPMVAVFDTAFHQTIPEENYRYAIPEYLYEKYGIRKYGFHGTSHKYITEVMKYKLQKENPNLIIAHLGSGSSISAIKDGKCFNTSMGLTPLDGLVMGTRSGAIDASIVPYLQDLGYSSTEITNLLNMESGLLGLCGKSDLRDVESLAKSNNKDAILALKLLKNSVVDYIAKYYFELNGNVDALVFTAGIGENSAHVREEILNAVEKPLNIKINDELNNKVAGFKDIHEAIISTTESKIPVYVVPTNEEKMILEDTYKIVKEKEQEKKYSI